MRFWVAVDWRGYTGKKFTFFALRAQSLVEAQNEAPTLVQQTCGFKDVWGLRLIKQTKKQELHYEGTDCEWFYRWEDQWTKSELPSNQKKWWNVGWSR